MKKFGKQDKRTSIDKEIDRVVEVMSITKSDSEEYKEMAINLELLMKGRSYSKDTTKISKDVLVTGLFSVLSILIIIGYEQGHVMASKAIGFVVKGRV